MKPSDEQITSHNFIVNEGRYTGYSSSLAENSKSTIPHAILPQYPDSHGMTPCHGRNFFGSVKFCNDSSK